MGDILGAVFGSGQRTTQQQTPDPVSQALNTLRLQQLEYLFNGPGGAPYGSYANARPDIYGPAPEVADLYGLGKGAYEAGRSQANQSLYDANADIRGSTYRTGQGAGPTIQSLADLRGLQDTTDRRLQPFTEGVGAINTGLYQDIDRALTGYGQGIQSANATLSGINGINAPPVDYSNLISLDEYKKLGLDSAANYISQIARPEILSTAALQGLEGGGIVPEALAKATAGIALPFVQGLPGASTALTLAPQQAELIRKQREAVDVQRQLGLSGQLASNVGQLANLQTGAAAQRAGLAGNNLLNLGQQQLGLGQLGLGYGNLAQGALTNAGQLQLGLGGLEANNLLNLAQLGTQTSLGFAGLGPSTIQSLFPLADYTRGLSEQDLLRRQGVVTSGLTGLPFTPGSTTTGRQSSQPLFNFFGQG